MKTTETKMTEVSTYYLPASAFRAAVLQYIGVADGEVVLTDNGVTVRVTREQESAVVDGEDDMK